MNMLVEGEKKLSGFLLSFRSSSVISLIYNSFWSKARAVWKGGTVEKQERQNKNGKFG